MGPLTFGIILLQLIRTCRSDVECNQAFNCTNITISTYDEDIDCVGYGSCISSDISTIDDGNLSSSNTDIWCGGLRSCQYATITTIKERKNIDFSRSVDTTIFSYLGLAFAKQVTLAHHDQQVLDCYGEGSCYGIQSITNSYHIKCDGARSCSNIGSAYTTRIYGFGTFALLGSNFYSYKFDESDEVYINLYGYYSGFNASFWCLQGFTCYVDCGINGCVNFNYYCDENAVECTVECGDGVICPNGWSSNGVYNGNFDSSIFDADNYTLSYTNDFIDELYNKVYSEDIYYEETYECPNNNKIISRLGCDVNDYYGCANNGDIKYLNDSLCVNGGRGIFHWSDLNITGNDSTLYCHGDRSCGEKPINFDGNDVYCRGFGSCGQFTNVGNIIATGSYSLGLLGNIKNGNEIFCGGHTACFNMDYLSNVKAVYATGDESLTYTPIYSNGSDIDIYLLAYRTSRSDLTPVTCTGTDTCRIYGLDDNYGGIDPNGVKCDSSNECTIEWIIIDTSGDRRPDTPTLQPTPMSTNTTKMGDDSSEGNTFKYSCMASISIFWIYLVLAN